MAIYTSRQGKFQVVALSFAPAIIAVGERVQMTIRLKNTSGAALSGVDARISGYYRSAAPNPGGYRCGAFFDAPLELPADYGPFGGRSWARNAELTVTQTLDFSDWGASEAPDRTARCIQPAQDGPWDFDPGSDAVGLCVQLIANQLPTWDIVPDLSGGYIGDLALLSYRWSPTVALSLQRSVVRDGVATPDDEGERLMMTSQLAMSAHADPSQMFCRLYYANDADADMDDSYIDLAASVPALLAGVTDDVSVVPRTFSNGSDWYFLLAFGDQYETAFAPASIALAFANMHLSGASTGGAAFGRYSSSTEGNPKLESAYPIFAYGGIEGVTNYATGEVNTGGRWVDGKPVYRSVLTGTTPASATSGQWITLATVPDLDTPIRFTGFVQRYVLPAAIGTMNIAVNVGVSGEIMLNFQNYVVSFRNQPFLFIVEYTKTTD